MVFHRGGARVLALLPGGQAFGPREVAGLLSGENASPEVLLTQGNPDLSRYERIENNAARLLIQSGAPVTLQVATEGTAAQFANVGNAFAHGIGIAEDDAGGDYIIYSNRAQQGYSAHYDPGYVCQICLFGNKTWFVADTSTKEWPEDRPALDADAVPADRWKKFETVPGDVLIIAPGYPHRTASTGLSIGLTYHITFQRRVDVLLAALLNCLLESDADKAEWLAPVPPTGEPQDLSWGKAELDALRTLVSEALPKIKPTFFSAQVRNALSAKGKHNHFPVSDPDEIYQDTRLRLPDRGLAPLWIDEESARVVIYHAGSELTFDRDDDSEMFEAMKKIATRQDFVAGELLEGSKLTWDSLQNTLITLVEIGALVVHGGPPTNT